MLYIESLTLPNSRFLPLDAMIKISRLDVRKNTNFPHKIRHHLLYQGFSYSCQNTHSLKIAKVNYSSNFLFTGYQSYPSQRDQTNGQNNIKSGMSLIPQFDTTIPTNVTALVGKSAYLSCKVQNLGNKTVSITFSFVGRFFNPNALPISA